jgi:mannose-6-phosphate isomerase-like protein (cupin superfamily)
VRGAWLDVTGTVVDNRPAEGWMTVEGRVLASWRGSEMCRVRYGDLLYVDHLDGLGHRHRVFP